MNGTAGALELSVIMRFEGRGALLLPLLDASFYRSLIDAHDFMVLVYVDIQSFAHRDDQVFLIELRVALQSFVIDVFRDVAQFRKRFMLQFVMCVCHVVLSKK
jgi:hypothetical protein